jgi:GTP pyrophosphokinase
MVSITDKKTGTTSKESLNAEHWLAALAPAYSAAELDIIRRACEWAQRAHAGQDRASGEPYFQHSLAVANILVGLHLDHETIAAALLHDVIEDTPVTFREIDDAFGARIAKLVDGVTKMEVIQSFQSRAEGVKGKKEQTHAEALRKMLLAMAEDVRVVLIKLADRTHNMRTLDSLPEQKRVRIAEETLHIYAPLANRLGIWQIKWELEDLALRVLHPDDYKQIAGMVNERRVDRERYIAHFVKILTSALSAAGLRAEISGRPKHIYSIWSKMRKKNTDYHKIYDIRAVRILVPEVRDCYAALGVVHGLWQYIPGEFDDYIATPKENNYQSIHTAVIGPEGKTVEVQIRTFDMHQHSELGVAAHWRYKEGGGYDAGLDRKVSLLRQLLEWKEDISQAGEAGEDLQADLFQDRVYVFSPKGDIIDLPVGATPLDFAYHIHTELGNRCRGAKVNGNMVPLTYSLQSGQQVEILTVKKGGPSRDWLNPNLGYLKTSRARHKAQHWFKQQNMEANVIAGRAIFERDIHRLGFAGINYEEVARRLNYAKTDEMLAAIGRGDVKTSRILHVIQDLQEPAPETKSVHPISPAAPQRPAGGGDIQIQGVGNLMTNLGRCCKPVPGDDIVGFITRGRGVTIHRRDCSNVLRYQNDHSQRLIEVEWGGAAQTYPVNIHIVAFDRQGLLRDITSVLANEKINVTAVQTRSDKTENVAYMTLTLEISNIDELSKMLQKLSQLPNIIEVKRERR